MNTRKLLAVLLAGVTAAGLWGCGTSQVKIQSSAQADVSMPEHIKRVAVLDFRNVGRRDRYIYMDGSQFSNTLVAALSQEGYYELVERTAVERVKDELARSATIQFDQQSQKEIGKLLNADALIFGTISTNASENRSVVQRTFRVATGEYREEPIYDQYGNVVRTRQVPIYKDELREVPTLSRQVSLRVDFRMVDVETGKVLASKQKTPNPQTRTYEGQYIGQCPSHQALLDQAVRESITEFVRYISPHRIVVQRYLIKGESDQTRMGYDFAMKQNWGAARQSWEAALKINPGDVAAINNLGVYYETQGLNQKALQYYQQALKLAPGNSDIIANLRDFQARVFKRRQ